jgi:hypothetical protein
VAGLPKTVRKNDESFGQKGAYFARFLGKKRLISASFWRVMTNFARVLVA